MSDLETAVVEAAPAPVQERNFDTEAREMGWVPQDDFKGPAEKWKPAQQFVEDGERILPIVRAQLKAEREKTAKREAEFQDRVDRLERVSQTALAQQKRQHEAELARITGEQRKAVEAGDVKEFDRLSGDLEKLQKTAPSAGPDIETQKAEFIKANPWFNTDFDMHTTAVNYSNWLAQQEPSLTFADNAARTVEYMKGKFPDKFGDKPAEKVVNGLSAVDGGGAFPGARTKPNSAATLPAEARAAGERFVKQGLYKDLEAYAKEYHSG